jgi:hypothetical protein
MHSTVGGCSIFFNSLLRTLLSCCLHVYLSAVQANNILHAPQFLMLPGGDAGAAGDETVPATAKGGEQQVGSRTFCIAAKPLGMCMHCVVSPVNSYMFQCHTRVTLIAPLGTSV